MSSIYRIIDANLNRAHEGLRIAEEITRFILNDRELTEELKKMRHALDQACRDAGLNTALLLEARNTEEDVGTDLNHEGETRRSDYEQITVANLKRVQEATRVLEEFGKMLSPKFGLVCKQIRYHTYTIEKKMVEVLRERRIAMDKQQIDYGLYVTTGEKFACGRSYEEVVKQAIAGGAKTIQLREKEKTTKELVELGKMVRRITREAGVLFIVNDRVDVALAVDADGVHLGQTDLPAPIARRLIGPEKILGISTTTLEEAVQAEKDGADYIGFGPIYTTQSKEDAAAPKGLGMLGEVRKAVGIPIVAIGGINAANAAEVIKAGADSIAVISAVVSASDIAAAARNLCEIIAAAKGME